MTMNSQDHGPWQELLDVVARLRDPNGGCPWDLEQSHSTLVPFLIEECFELVEAIETGSEPNMVEELGDVLLQIVLHSQIAKDRGRFDINQVVTNLKTKMVRRHPHVFGDAGNLSTEAVLSQWAEIKAAEKSQNQTMARSGFSLEIPTELPALSTAAKMGSKSKKFRFDWPNWRGAFEKVKEEITELEEALLKNPELPKHVSPNLTEPGTDKDPIAHEIGDLLFAIAQVARHRGLDPEQCLRQANRRFENRLGRTLSLAQQTEATDGRSFESRSIDEIESIWQKAKAEARNAGEE